MPFGLVVCGVMGVVKAFESTLTLLTRRAGWLPPTTTEGG